MLEQGRATVLAWQQTVDAAWQRQSSLLTGGPGAPNLDAARQEFFGPADPGAQREIRQTNATVPGGRDGIIVSRFFIANPNAAFATLHGDGRGPTTDPNAGYRFAIAWDTRTGEVSLTVNQSTFNSQYLRPDTNWPEKVEVPAHPITTEPGGEPNNFVVDESGPGQLKVSYNALNSVYPIGEANGTVDIRLDPNNVSVHLKGDDYPDGEFIQYRSDGARLLGDKPMSGLQEGAVTGAFPYDKRFTAPR